MCFRTVLFGLLFGCAVFAQDSLICKCAAGDSTTKSPDSVFVFRNGMTLALCGSITVDTREVTFSAFRMILCGPDSVVGTWDENKTCRILFNRDLLTVQGMFNLPVGPGFNYKPVPLLLDQFSFDGSVLKRKTRVGDLKRLKPAEAAKVVRDYEAMAKPVTENPEDPLNRLFMAAVSGNKSAYRHFMGFATDNPELDGDTQIQFNELLALLRYFPMP